MLEDKHPYLVDLTVTFYDTIEVLASDRDEAVRLAEKDMQRNFRHGWSEASIDCEVTELFDPETYHKMTPEEIKIKNLANENLT